ncbi:MAG: hypothetical protein IJ543_04315 [Bacteroidales bacterium]|nr:hypothetical protein [Bacteroidales bacterium]
MVISIKQNNLTVSVNLDENSFENKVTCEEVLIAAYDIISRIYSDKSVVQAYYNTDPDTKARRHNDDPIVIMNPYKY